MPNFIGYKVRKNANVRNRYNQVPQLTRDTIWKSVKNKRKHYIQENQEVSSFPAGDPKAPRNRQDNMADKHETNNKNSYQRRWQIPDLKVNDKQLHTANIVQIFGEMILSVTALCNKKAHI